MCKSLSCALSTTGRKGGGAEEKQRKEGRVKIFKYSKIFKSSMGKCLQSWFRARLSEKKPFALWTEEKEVNTERPSYPVLAAEIRT